MELAWIVNILTNIVVMGMAWFLKTQHADLKDLRKALQETRESYVHRDEIRELKQEMTQRFDRMEKLLIDTIRRE